MDITSIFKACVKAIQVSRKALSIEHSAQKHSILQSRSEIDIKAKKILYNIQNLQELLLKNRKNYSNFRPYQESSHGIDYSQFDVKIEQLISVCTNLIQQFKKEISSMKGSPQLQEHYINLGYVLSAFLKRTCREFFQQKSNRVKKSMEVFHLSKLETKQLHASYTNYDYDDYSNEPEIELSADELQLFEEENRNLLNELNSYSNEVKQLESKIVQIAELQQLFTEKILEQDVNVEQIASTVFTTNTNILDANEQIRQAIQRNAGLRVWILFFLLVMSLTILFLDWYND